LEVKPLHSTHPQMNTKTISSIPPGTSRGLTRCSSPCGDVEAGRRSFASSEMKDTDAIQCPIRTGPCGKGLSTVEKREFKCEICLKLFSSKSALNTHLRNVHVELRTAEPYKCNCGKSFSTERGLKLHETRYCPNSKNMSADCADQPLNDAASLMVQACDQILDSTHIDSDHLKSAFSHSRHADTTGSIDQTKKKPKLRLPASCNERKWKRIEEDFDIAFRKSAPEKSWGKQTATDLMSKFETVLYDVLSLHCKSEVKKSLHCDEKPKDELLKVFKTKIRNLKREVRRLNRNQADNGHTLQLLFKTIRAHNDYLNLVKRDSNKLEAFQQKKKFFSDPWKFSQRLLDGELEESKPAGEPNFSSDTCFEFFKTKYKDAERNHVYSPPSNLERPNFPQQEFDTNKPLFEEMLKCLRKKRNASSPGINGISYKVYKSSRRIAHQLWKLLCHIWERCEVPSSWSVAWIKLLEKKEGCDSPDAMRPISILNVEGRIFFSLLEKRLSSYMTSNGYIKRHQQKAFMNGVAGCVEHSSLIFEALKDAKQEYRSICLIMLDFANAYGSVRHNLIQFALNWYHLPDWLQQIVFKYYERIQASVMTSQWETDPFDLEIGLFQGCCMSVMIFNIVFQILLDYHSQFCKKTDIGYKFKDADITVINPSFADDVTLAASDARSCQVSIDAFQEIVNWTATMSFKPSKCRSWGGRYFGPQDKTKYTKLQDSTYAFYDPLLKVNDVPVLCVGNDTKNAFMFKMLGRQLQWDLKDDKVREKISHNIECWLKRVDESRLSGIIKTWIVDNVMVSRLSWSLLIYDFPASVVLDWQTALIRHYKKWLKVCRCAETSIFFRDRKDFGLGLKDLEVENKCFNVVKWHLLKYSLDDQMRNLYRDKLFKERSGKIGRGRNVDDAPAMTIEKLEDDIAFRDQFQTGVTGHQLSRSGIGYGHFQTKQYDECTNKEKRQLLTAQIRNEAEKKRILVLMSYNMQNGFLNWGMVEAELEGQDLAWKKVLNQYSDRLLSFVLNAQLNTLPTPNNLKLWNSSKNLTCGLCGKSDGTTFGHIMGGCPWVLNVENKTEGRVDRYTWRHNNVLRVLCNAIVKKIQQRNADKVLQKVQPICFVKATGNCDSFKNSTIAKPKLHRYGELTPANDWSVYFDLPELKDFSVEKFPQEVCKTDKRVDAFILSRQKKICLVGPELTVPIEERIAIWNKEKTSKYGTMLVECSEPEWKTKLFVVEVGCRGYLPPNFNEAMHALGFTGREIQQLVEECSLVARRSSYYIWINRFSKQFVDFRMVEVNVENYKAIAVR
jgi:Reverse transcriptase (RNA-dependent DNA polymerase)